MSLNVHRQKLSAKKEIVIKVGTQVLMGKDGLPDLELIQGLCDQMAALKKKGYHVTLVSSGAIGMGLGVLGRKKRPTELPMLQATAAVGQAELVHLYRVAMDRHGMQVGQILLTYDDFDNRTRYLNARNTIISLLEMGVLPIINENDTISTEEIRFGDNDELSALVANMLGAEALIILTTADGVLRFDKEEEGQVVPITDESPEALLSQVRSSKTALGRGGMGTKLVAAAKAVKTGEYCVIANGREPGVLVRLMDGESIGTLFVPGAAHFSSYKRWLGFGRRAVGKLVIDDGAVEALVKKNKSLLPGGIQAVEGAFAPGDVVAITNLQGQEIARGLSNYSAADIEKIRGLKTKQIQQVLGRQDYPEVVHRDNLAVTV